MNKQIEEMAKIIAQSVDEETLCDGLAGDSSMACFCCDYSEKEYCKHHLESATGLYNKGYRKTEDVAMEIFEEIEKTLSSMKYNANTPRKTVKVEELKEQVDWVLHEVVPSQLAELKKKYESENNNG